MELVFHMVFVVWCSLLVCCYEGSPLCVLVDQDFQLVYALKLTIIKSFTIFLKSIFTLLH